LSLIHTLLLFWPQYAINKVEIPSTGGL